MILNRVFDALDDRVTTNLYLRKNAVSMSVKTFNPFKFYITTPRVVNVKCVQLFVFFFQFKFS